MGRVKKYSKQHSNKHKKLARKEKAENNEDAEMVESGGVLPIAKRKQIFKKKDRREVKKRITELRL